MTAEAADPAESSPTTSPSDPQASDSPQEEPQAKPAIEEPAEQVPDAAAGEDQVAHLDAYISEEPEEEPEPEPPVPEVFNDFDIKNAEPLGFAALESARTDVFASQRSRDRFQESLLAMDTSGEEGRRRALGWWVLAEYQRAADELQSHEQEDTAAFTRGKALGSLKRWGEAAAIFERLSKAYPEEPRPRAALLEARLEAALAQDPEDTEALADEIAGAVAQAPGNFAETPEGLYIAARAAEVRRDWEAALNSYEKGFEAGGDPNRVLISRFAHLAERMGEDERAISLYEELLNMPPVERSTLMNLGVLYEDHGRDSDAAACYDIVNKNDGTDELARLYLSDARAAMEMYYDEDMEKKEDRLNQILRIPITDFELSVRARNCLNKMQINTLGDLVMRTEQELLSYKNFGETSLHEIKEILHSKGLRLGMPRDEAVASIEAHARRMNSGDRGDVMNKPILELQLSIRARRTVESLGCLTVGDITKHSAEELLGMPNFGQTSLQELRNKLGELSIKLKGE